MTAAALSEQLQHVFEVFGVATLIGRYRDGVGVFLDGGRDRVFDRAVVSQMGHFGAANLKDEAHDVDGGVVAFEQARGRDKTRRRGARAFVLELRLGTERPPPPLGNHDMAHLVDISSLRTAPRCHNKRRSAGATSYLVIPFGNDNRISRLPSQLARLCLLRIVTAQLGCCPFGYRRRQRLWHEKPSRWVYRARKRASRARRARQNAPYPAFPQRACAATGKAPGHGRSCAKSG